MSILRAEKTKHIIQAEDNLFGVCSMSDKSKGAIAIGACLAQLRKEKGITQGEMAELLNVSQPMISDYERGGLRLHGELIIELTKILKVSADTILGIEKSSSQSFAIKNRRLHRRLKEIERLSKRDQDALLRTIDAYTAKLK